MLQTVNNVWESLLVDLMEHGQCVFLLFLVDQLLMCIIDGLQEGNIKPRLETKHTTTQLYCDALDVRITLTWHSPSKATLTATLSRWVIYLKKLAKTETEATKISLFAAVMHYCDSNALQQTSYGHD